VTVASPLFFFKFGQFLDGVSIGFVGGNTSRVMRGKTNDGILPHNLHVRLRRADGEFKKQSRPLGADFADD